MTYLAQNLNSDIDLKLDIDISNQSLGPLGIKGAVLVLEPATVQCPLYHYNTPAPKHSLTRRLVYKEMLNKKTD